MARIAVGQKNRLQPAMRAQAGFERMIRRVADESRVIRPYRKEGRITVDEGGTKSFVDSHLTAQAAVEIFRSVEGVVRFRNVERENCSVKPCFVPLPGPQRVGKLCAVDANLPGQETVCIQLGFAILRRGGFVAAGQAFEREAAVPVEANEVIVPLGGIFWESVQ